MDLQDGSYDVVIDKATFDSIVCAEGSTDNIDKVLSEIHRVLKQDGVYLMVSYASSEHRLTYLQKEYFNWDVKVEKVNKPTMTTSITIQADDRDSLNLHYIYICKKRVGEQ